MRITKCAYVPAYRNGLKKDRKKDREGGERRKRGEREEWKGMQGKVEAAGLKPEKPPKAAASLRAERGVAHFSSDMNLQGTEVCWKNG